MRDPGLIMRTLLWYRGSTSAVLLGVALATAVLTGALVVGDSVAGSLNVLRKQRFGDLTHTLFSPRPFPAELAKRLSGTSAGLGLRGSVSRPDGPRHGQVQLLAAELPLVKVAPGGCLLNQTLAELLGVNAGERITVRLPDRTITADHVPFAERSGAVRILRPVVQRIVPATGLPGRFSLHARQRQVRNCWLNLAELAEAAGILGRANLLLGQYSAPDQSPQEKLQQVLTLADYGLTLQQVEGLTILTAEQLYLGAEIERAARQITLADGGQAQGVTVHLMNTVTHQSRSAPYLVAAGLEQPPGGPLPAGTVALNAWAARDLAASAGSLLELSFYRRQTGGILSEVMAEKPFKVSRVVPMTGLGAMPSLTPKFPGLTEAENMGDWDPPPGLPIELGRIRQVDEDYWDKWRAAPRLFFSLAQARALWGDEFGGLSSLRLQGVKASFAQRLARAIEPARAGFHFRACASDQGAGGNTTDFAGLFIGFSFFIIAAAALLVGLLFSLSLADRLPQTGLLGVFGFTPRRIGRLQMLTGVLLALVGGVVGVPGGIAYAALMVWGLDTCWSGAVGAGFLSLHVESATMVMGFGISTCVCLFSLWRGARQSARLTPLAALGQGREAIQVLRRQGKSGGWWGPLFLFASAVVMLLLSATGSFSYVGGFFAGGFLLLIAMIAMVRMFMVHHGRLSGSGGRFALLALAMRNAGRQRQRSLLVVSLVAAAVFIIVIVAAMQQGEGAPTWQRESGAGGYTLLTGIALPLPYSPADPAGRKLLGIHPDREQLWQQLNIQAMRVRPGDGLSCFNLYRPEDPRILSVPRTMRERGGFTFTQTCQPGEKPWSLLEAEFADGRIPVFADAEAARWNLHKGIGDPLTVVDESGQQQQLFLAGLLKRSIFQSELLMSEANFKRLFPSRSGYQQLLISAPRDMQDKVANRLRKDLVDFGPEVETTAARLAAFGQVAGTYMDAFQALGSFGLLLGLAGLAVLMLRTMGERRQELALLAALGHGRRNLLLLVVGENSLLMVAGLAAGTIAALVAALPWILATESATNPWQLGLVILLLTSGGLLVQWLVATATLSPAITSGKPGGR